MDDRLVLNIKIADRDYKLRSIPEEEIFVREAARMIRERIDVHRSRGVRDTQDVLALVALDCLVASLKIDDQARQTQTRVHDRLSQLNQNLASGKP